MDVCFFLMVPHFNWIPTRGRIWGLPRAWGTCGRCGTCRTRTRGVAPTFDKIRWDRNKTPARTMKYMKWSTIRTPIPPKQLPMGCDSSFCKVAGVSPRHPKNLPKMVPMDLTIGFQGLALIQGQLYNPLDEQLASEPPCDLMYIIYSGFFPPQLHGDYFISRCKDPYESTLFYGSAKPARLLNLWKRKMMKQQPRGGKSNSIYHSSSFVIKHLIWKDLGSVPWTMQAKQAGRGISWFKCSYIYIHIWI